ncbi:MAG: hypothetical protein WCZ87_09215 [Thiohalobacteraceae bacterium]
MPSAGLFSMRLSPQQLEDFCRQLRQRARDPATALQQLSSLQAFMTVAVGDTSQPGYRHARDCLDRQLDAVREQLLAQHAAALQKAIEARDGASIVRSFLALSRSGFDAAAARAWPAVQPALRDACAAWLLETTRDMQQRARAASRYPDAPDFRAAGIDVDTFLALMALQESV